MDTTPLIGNFENFTKKFLLGYNKVTCAALIIILVISVYLFATQTYLPIGFGSTAHFLPKIETDPESYTATAALECTETTVATTEDLAIPIHHLVQLQEEELIKLKSEIKVLEEKLNIQEMENSEKTGNSKSNSNQAQRFRYGLNNCDMETCFNYAMCPITNKFSIYVYPDIYKLYTSDVDESSENSLAFLHSALSNNYQITHNPTEACVFIVVLHSCDCNQCLNENIKYVSPEPPVLNEDSGKYFNLKELQHWSGDGSNHLIWSICDCCDSDSDTEINKSSNNFNIQKIQDFGKAMIVSKMFSKSEFRPRFDLVVNHVSDAKLKTALPLLIPVKRKFLASFISETVLSLDSSIELAQVYTIFQNEPSRFFASFQFLSPTTSTTLTTTSKSVETTEYSATDDFLGNSSTSAPDTTVVSTKKSTPKPKPKPKSVPQNSPKNNNNTEKLLQSTFSLIMLEFLESDEEMVLTNNRLQRQLFKILKSGAIPVVLGSQFQFPFSEFIDWSKVALTFPLGRMSELPFILKSVSDSDILNLRRNGRRVFVKYLSSMDSVVETLLAGVRTRIGVPPMPYERVPSPSLYPNSSKPVDSSFDLIREKAKLKNMSDALGPLKSPFSSPKFRRNVTSSLFLDKYELWNVHYQPFRLLPSTPWDISVPSEARVNVTKMLRNNKYVSGVRPAYGGDGRNTKAFTSSLGGNCPPEQFTVVMLTYKREVVLMDALRQLVSLPYLNSVVVIWNAPEYPLANVTWPDIGVPVHTIKAVKNSLNNRFLPYDVIETDAILSLDDDTSMSHEEIVFGFRIWRENRERMVGYPGRFHGWDVTNSRWYYEAGDSCEYSMVLTGAAFFHKYYAYMYTFEMPAVIREEVDRRMNCEDLAMNFLVSYLTQKPPIKVTPRKTFTCPKCKGKALSSSGSHYAKRDACINAFTKVFGYATLLYTQFRADSTEFGFKSSLQCFKGV